MCRPRDIAIHKRIALPRDALLTSSDPTTTSTSVIKGLQNDSNQIREWQILTLKEFPFLY